MENNTCSIPVENLSSCELFADGMWKLHWQGVFFYSLVLPYFLITFPTRIVSLMAFVIEARKESAYMYQIFLSIAELFESFVFFVSRITKTMLTGPNGATWFLKCYACMFYDAHFANMSHMAAHLWVLSLTICMTGDRIFALSYPMKYNKSTNQRTIQYGVFGFSILFTFMFSFLIYFAATLNQDESTGVYSEKFNTWSGVTTPFIFVHTCTKLLCTLVIVLLNTILFLLFRYRMRHKATLGIMTTEGTNKAFALKKEIGKVQCLFRLTLIQAISSLVAISGVFAYNAVDYAWRWYPSLDCVSDAITLFADIMREIGEIPTFFVMMALAKPFRTTVIKGLKDVLGESP